jgi:hypothetical protein
MQERIVFVKLDVLDLGISGVGRAASRDADCGDSEFGDLERSYDWLRGHRYFWRLLKAADAAGGRLVRGGMRGMRGKRGKRGNGGMRGMRGMRGNGGNDLPMW